MANIQPVHSPCYCINYRRAANTLTKYYDAAFAPIGLTGNQFFLLNSIQQLGSCNKSELAQYTSLDRTTIIRNLDTLLKKELVEPAPGANRRNSGMAIEAIRATIEIPKGKYGCFSGNSISHSFRFCQQAAAACFDTR